MYSIYQPGTNTPHRKSTQISDGFYVLWNRLTFQKERVVWAGRRQGNTINRCGRAFSRAGSAVSEVKGEPIHLIQGLGNGHVSCPTVRTEPRGF